MSNRKQSFDEILKEDFARAAEDIEREVEESDVEHMSDSLKQSIHAKLQEQIAAYENEKVYAQLTEEDRKALELGKEVMRQQEEETAEKKVVRKKERLRGYLVIVAALVLAMALGVTSMGGANRVISIVKSVVGDREVVKTAIENDLGMLPCEAKSHGKTGSRGQIVAFCKETNKALAIHAYQCGSCDFRGAAIREFLEK